MTKVIKEEFEKLVSLMINDVSLTCNTSLEIFNEEFNRMSRIDDDLLTYEVENSGITNILCDSNKEDDSEQQMSHETDDDIEYDPSDVEVRGDDEVELTNEESSDSDAEDEVAEIFRIKTNVFNFETPLCKAFKEFNFFYKSIQMCFLKILKDLRLTMITRMIRFMNGTKMCHGHMKNHGLALEYGLNPLQLNIVVGEWDNYEITNHDNEYENEHGDEKRYELCDDATQGLPVCTIRRFEMIKNSFGQDEEYVAVKEHEYEDLTSTSEDACRAYQEILRKMDKGWMVTRPE
nr:hypothetical protein [Tanacetum cinerariifolium]